MKSSLRREVIAMLKKSGQNLNKKYGRIEATHNKGRGPADVVTKLDVQTEKIYRARLKKIVPEIEFVGEETGGNRKAQNKWLCDPIDGTGHFIRGVPFCSTMIALVEDGQVNFAAIYNFPNDDMYVAERGKGSFCNNKRIKVSNRDLDNAYFTYESKTNKKSNRLLLTKVNSKSGIIKTISAGYEFSLVASGKMDGRISVDPYGNDYDYAPGSLLVEEAGGVVANIGSKTYDYRNYDFLATNKVVYKQLTQGKNALFPIK
ncbi:hypothetical protein CL622_04835 [archaeon]|nr:hypothetical protein [archaeon]